MKSAARLCLGFILLAVFPLARSVHAEIHYTVSLSHPEQHTFHIRMIVPAQQSDREIIVAVPAWNALYQVRDFAYRVGEVQATTPGGSNRPLHVYKLDKQTWRISLPKDDPETAVRGAEISYTILWNDSGPFNSQLNDHHAFMNFGELLMYVPDRRGEESAVNIEDAPVGWRSVAALPVGGAPNSFTAPSYDKLVDAPVEVGKFQEFDFDNSGAHFRVVVDAKEWKKSALEDALKRITGYEMQLMGGPPFKEYTFFFHLGPYREDGGGGMEHANCTAIGANSLESAISIAAHEFFHAWNVKRIRPQSLEPVDYTKEQYSRALWFAEGVTSTYGSYTLERSGLWSKEQFYSDLAGEISELEARPARKWQSLEESSLDTWFDKYDDYNRPDRSISYYNKGQIVGVMLDLAIRDATDNRKSLDDVLRTLNDEYAKQGKFYDGTEGIRSVVEEVSGKDFREFFNSNVAEAGEVAYGSYLSAAGLELKIEKHQTADLGFYPGRGPGGSIAVAAVEPNSAAETAGMLTGDVLVKINGQDVTKNPAGVLRGFSPGQNVKVHIRREDRELDISYMLGSREDVRYSIVEISQPNDKQRRIREGLLRGATDRRD